MFIKSILRNAVEKKRRTWLDQIHLRSRPDVHDLAYLVASSSQLRHSAGTSARKNSAVRGRERTPVGKLYKRSFRVYQDLLYPLIGQFWQILSTLEHRWRKSEIDDMAANRELSTSENNAVFKSVLNNWHAKRWFSPSDVPSRRTGLHKNMFNGRCLCNASHR